MGKKRISITMNDKLNDKLSERAKMFDVSKSSLAALALSHFFSQMEMLERENKDDVTIYDIIKQNYQQQIYENEQKLKDD